MDAGRQITATLLASLAAALGRNVRTTRGKFGVMDVADRCQGQSRWHLAPSGRIASVRANLV